MKKALTAMILVIAVVFVFTGCNITPELDTYTVTFDSNGGTAVESIENIESGSKLQKPDDPEYAGYDFKGWYKDSQLTSEWSWENDTVAEDMTLFAGWVVAGPSTYVFESEDTDLRTIKTPEWSWYPPPTYVHHVTDVGASGDRFAFGMYEAWLSLNFYLISDEDVNDVTFIARLSAEYWDMIISSDMFEISLNDAPILYEPISLIGVPQFINDGKVRCIPFEDYTIATNMSLKKGENHIRFMPIKEEEFPGLTYTSKAPLIDCVKLTTKATVGWSASHGLPKANY